MAFFEGVFGNPNESPNALMRFGAALQGPQAQALQMEQIKQSKLAKLAPLVQQGDKTALMEMAAIDPQAAGALASLMGDGGYKVQEINGQLVRFNPQDPNSKPEVIFGGGGGLNPKTVEGESTLRKEFDGLNKDYRVVQDAYNKIQRSATDPSAAGDLALIFSYMKILDPGSTVREGEFANAQNAAGVPTMIQNLYNRAKTGERLQPEQRADFLNQSRNLYEAQAQGYQQGIEKYRALAKDYGYNPDRIVKPLAEPKADPFAQKKAELRAKISAIKKSKGLK